MKTSILICIRSLCLFFLADLPASLCTCTRGTANSRPVQQVWRTKGRDQGRAERKHPEILPHDYLQEPCVQKCIPLSPGNSAGHCTRQARQRKEGAGGNGKRCAAQRLLPTERGGTQWKEAEPLHHFQDRKRLHGHFDLHRGSAQ